MSTTASQSNQSAPAAPKSSQSVHEAADCELQKTISRLYREQFHPVGPVEQTLVETLIHNCLQTHRIQ
ncbi:MAG TPA: hypothetical protein PLZ95_02105, partial [Bryobacteraceae bacterium]|nr:hypothetical protein [Bryobacteraceae bacterium]